MGGAVKRVWGKLGVWTFGIPVLVLVAAFILIAPMLQKQADVAGASSACASAMRDAAAVPVAEVNDVEMVRTVDACADVDEWVAALRAYPDALGVTSSSIDPKFDLAGVCSQSPSSPVCTDAVARGVVTSW